MTGEPDRDFLRADLAAAWERVAQVDGPELGDLSTPLRERIAAFRARLLAFRNLDGETPA